MRTTAHRATIGRKGGNAGYTLVTRLCLASLLSAGLCSAADEISLPALAQLAAALSQGDSVAAMEGFDSKMDQYGSVESAIGALTAQTDILCAIELVEEKEVGDTLTVETDWYLQLKSRSEGGTTERRRERVTLRFKKSHQKWRITAFSPISILAPVIVR